MAVYNLMDVLTFYCTLLRVPAASGFMDDCKMCVRGHIFGGYIGSLAVD